MKRSILILIINVIFFNHCRSVYSEIEYMAMLCYTYDNQALGDIKLEFQYGSSSFDNYKEMLLPKVPPGPFYQYGRTMFQETYNSTDRFVLESSHNYSILIRGDWINYTDKVFLKNNDPNVKVDIMTKGIENDNSSPWFNKGYIILKISVLPEFSVSQNNFIVLERPGFMFLNRDIDEFRVHIFKNLIFKFVEIQTPKIKFNINDVKKKKFQSVNTDIVIRNNVIFLLKKKKYNLILRGFNFENVNFIDSTNDYIKVNEIIYSKDRKNDTAKLILNFEVNKTTEEIFENIELITELNNYDDRPYIKEYKSILSNKNKFIKLSNFIKLFRLIKPGLRNYLFNTGLYFGNLYYYTKYNYSYNDAFGMKYFKDIGNYSIVIGDDYSDFDGDGIKDINDEDIINSETEIINTNNPSSNILGIIFKCASDFGFSHIRAFESGYIVSSIEDGNCNIGCIWKLIPVNNIARGEIIQMEGYSIPPGWTLISTQEQNTLGSRSCGEHSTFKALIRKN